MHGFDVDGVDYEAEQIVDVAIPLEEWINNSKGVRVLPGAPLD